MKETDRSPLETYFANEDAATKLKARRHSTPRLDAFRVRLPDISTSTIFEYISDYRARDVFRNVRNMGHLFFDVLLCCEVLVPYVDSGKGWTGPSRDVPGRPPVESYPDDDAAYDTLYAGYVAICDELDRRFPPTMKHGLGRVR